MATRLRSRLPAPVRGALRRARNRVARRPSPAPAPAAAAAPWERWSRGVPVDRLRRAHVSELLLARLDDADVAAVEAALDAERREQLRRAGPTERPALTLAFGVHHGVEPVLEKTGLRRDEPPEDVHAMGRGPVAAGGSYYYADLVVEALAAGGFEPVAGARILDFGSSSGRVVRVLAAAYPEVRWLGCDPNRGAIEWAAAHLPGIEFAVSPQRPPLPHADGALDAAYAISIWSHFGPGAALAWLDEMHRLLAPGGLLVLSTHGFASLDHAARSGARSHAQLAEIARQLYSEGAWYAAEFGSAGDHGVVDPEWGTAFLSPEWVLRHATPRFSLRELRPGGVEDNQDLYVLRREG